MQKKRQHIIPRSYLGAWIDPATPPNQTDYVWVHSFDGTKPRNKAPENILWETDFYTIMLPDGSRNLVFEDGLAELEGWFATLRRSTLNDRLPLSDDDKLYLCLFAAVMHARTAVQRDRLRLPLAQMSAALEEAKEWFNSASETDREAARRQMAPHIAAGGDKISLSELKELHERPMQVSLAPTISALWPLLLDLQMTILESATTMTFYTSDNPCCIFSPQVPAPTVLDGPTIARPDVEVTLPLSPKQILLLQREPLADSALYQLIDDITWLQKLNKRTVRFAKEHVVLNHKRERPFRR